MTTRRAIVASVVVIALLLVIGLGIISTFPRTTRGMERAADLGAIFGLIGTAALGGIWIWWASRRAKQKRGD